MQIGGRSENVIHRKRASTTIDWKTCAKINYLISQRVTVYIKINNIKKMVNFALSFMQQITHRHSVLIIIFYFKEVC